MWSTSASLKRAQPPPFFERMVSVCPRDSSYLPLSWTSSATSLAVWSISSSIRMKTRQANRLLSNSGFVWSAPGRPLSFRLPVGHDPNSYFVLYWFSGKVRREEAAEGEIPPYGRGFSRHMDLSSDLFLGGVSRPLTCHRYDESVRLSLGKVASPQSLLPFHLTKSLSAKRRFSVVDQVAAGQLLHAVCVLVPACGHARYGFVSDVPPACLSV